MDKLEEIVGAQKRLLERVEEERGLPDTLNDKLLGHVHAIEDEAGELRRELDWKWWTNKKEVDFSNCREELIDVLHFTIQGLILLGCDASDIHRYYLDKNQTNHDRQDGKTDRQGYDVNSNETYRRVD